MATFFEKIQFLDYFGKYIKTEPYIVSTKDEKSREDKNDQIPIIRHQAILIGNTNDEPDSPFQNNLDEMKKFLKNGGTFDGDK